MLRSSATLLAQSDGNVSLSPSLLSSPYAPALIALLGAIVALWFVSAIIFRAFRLVRSSRKLKHLERLKAIEAGLPYLETPPMTETIAQEKLQTLVINHSLWISFWMMLLGAATPFVAVTSWLASSESSQQLTVVGLVAACLASIAASVCSAIVVAFARPHRPTRVQDDAEPTAAKPATGDGVQSADECRVQD